MNYYLAKCSELNFLLCIRHDLWAQQRNRMVKGSVQYCIFMILLFPLLAHAEWQARVVHVLDGDTLITSRGRKAEIIRLFGIDCPEKEQVLGPAARSFTSGMVAGKIIRVIPVRIKES